MADSANIPVVITGELVRAVVREYLRRGTCSALFKMVWLGMTDLAADWESNETRKDDRFVVLAFAERLKALHDATRAEETELYLGSKP